MLFGIAALLTFQLVGEVLSRAAALPLPGPVLGFLLLAAVMARAPALRAAVEPPAQGLLRHLSLLFVPAAVGIMQHLQRLGAEFVPIALAVLGSTVLAIAVTAATFVLIARAQARVQARLGRGRRR